MDSSLPNLKHDFPRVMTHELVAKTNAEAYSKYEVIATKGGDFPVVEKIQHQYSPDTIVLRHISGRAYQSFNYSNCAISGGVAFEATTAASQGGPKAQGCGIYAGHWLYKAGTKLRQNVSAGATTLPVADTKRIQKGQYVVIYNAPAGSFRNAEHAKVTGVNHSNRTIQVNRGYKSKAVTHASGSIVAQHLLGQGHEPELWAFNMTTQSPRDANGKTFGEFYADWLGNNLLRYNNGTRTTADIGGVLFDADFYFEYSGKQTDTDNDLVVDEGIGPNGQNWLGDGLDAFYQRVTNRLPGQYVLVGVHDARGFNAAHGGQMESWLDYGNGDFNPNPKYDKLSKLFAAYLYNMAERDQGPALVLNLTKTPTKTYPGNTNASSNAPFRLGLAMTLMEDGYFGTHTAKEPDAWYDEYAVDVRAGSADFGKAIPKSSVGQVHNHRGWLGKPLGSFRRIYSDTEFAPEKSLIGNNTFDKSLSGWASKNVSISRVTSGTQDGAGALRASRMNNFTTNESAAFVGSDRFNVQGGTTYTVAFSARAEDAREIRVAVGNDSYRVAVSKKWRRFVLTFRPTKSATTALKFGLGREDSQVWFDSVYVFNKDANVFQREFENGMALANATRSSKTISIGSGFRRINGRQDPINNGKPATSITLAPFDGIILVRDGKSTSTSTASDGDGDGGTNTGSGSGRIGDYVWKDKDGDGRQDGAEPGIRGVRVQLRDCSGLFIKATSTDANGAYLFDNIGGDSYMLRFVLPDDAAKFTRRAAGSDGSLDSDADGKGWSRCVDVPEGKSRRGIDAGIVY
ncbi:MAG TPA: SdrD B-like domain-containing protein [Woeseiaceae bacterium]|nr:SdrD B-like domain-containing protein [Woeseiaceae bacterium]